MSINEIITATKKAGREDQTFVVNACAIIAFCVLMTIISGAIVELEHTNTVKIVGAEFAMFLFAAGSVGFTIDFVKDITRR